MSPRGSKDKGRKYEHEIAGYLNDKVDGLAAKRAILSGSAGASDGADLDGTPLIHVECKRVERLAPKEAMAQAEAAIAKRRREAMPVVVTRTNGMATEESLVVMRLRDWVALYEAMLS